ncbi:MAG: hypothetical protein AAGL99_16965 [Pseudomonadota bacterium]
MAVEIRGKDTEHLVVSIDGKDVLRLTHKGPEWAAQRYSLQSEATKELMAWLRLQWRGEAPYERIAMNFWHIVKLAFFFAAVAILTIVFVSFTWVMWTMPWDEINSAPINWRWEHQGLVLGLNGVFGIAYMGALALSMLGLKDAMR